MEGMTRKLCAWDITVALYYIRYYYVMIIVITQESLLGALRLSQIPGVCVCVYMI